MTFTAGEIARATGGDLVRDGAEGPVVTDTRGIPRNAWFVALRGDRFDGHDFLVAAADAGAGGCVVSRTPPPEWKGGVVRVGDTFAALHALARAARDRIDGPVVAITGSSGKTTTRALTALALSPLGPVHQTTGNLNNQIGVPMTLLACPTDARAAVVELGTNRPGEIAVLADLVRPDVRIIVNVGPAHLEELGGLDGVAAEKGALFRSALPGQVCCVNGDDPRVASLPLPAGVRRVTYGERGDVALLEARVEAADLATRARIFTPEGEVEVHIASPGRHIAHDAAAAIAVATALGVDPRAAAHALTRYEPVGMRLRRETLPGGVVVLNDAYNANPDSMKASLGVLAGLRGRRVAVLGDMFELGVAEASWHREVATHARDLGLDLVILVGPRMASAAEPGGNVWTFVEPGDAVAPLSSWLRDGDTVLLKGSRGARMERILHGLRGEPLPEGDP